MVCREDSRISTAVVASVNTFLLANGLDVRSRVAQLQTAVHPFVLRAWGTARDAKLRDALVTYLRVQLCLGGLEAPESPFLQDVHELLMHTIEQPVFSW
jgi:hypothetical protein